MLLVTPVFLFIYYLLLNDIFNVMVNDISIHIFIIYHKNYSRIQIFDFNNHRPITIMITTIINSMIEFRTFVGIKAAWGLCYKN